MLIDVGVTVDIEDVFLTTNLVVLSFCDFRPFMLS